MAETKRWHRARETELRGQLGTAQLRVQELEAELVRKYGGDYADGVLALRAQLRRSKEALRRKLADDLARADEARVPGSRRSFVKPTSLAYMSQT